MKKMLLIVLILFSIPAFAQEETLIGQNFESGGFGGPVMKLTGMGGSAAIVTGARGGWIVNNQFVIGGGIYGSQTDASANDSLNFDIDYLGLELEYVHNPKDLFHWSAYTLIGWGDANFNHKNEAKDYDINDENFFIIEPAINGEMNVTSFFRLGAGLSYRYVVGVDRLGLTDSDVRGLTFLLTFKFGKF